MRKIIILFPRLDVTFKKGPVPTTRGEIPPIRLHWQNIGNMLLNSHKQKGDDVTLIEKPLWQFTPDYVESLSADIVYVPHKSVETFPVKGTEVRYYMQTVFPFQFYIDSKGFAGGSTNYPFNVNRTGDTFYNDMCKRARMNISKFDQPEKRINFKYPLNFAFFPCQIPHDETIKYHSDVSVEQALEATCKATEELGMGLIVKGHPVNPGSMVGLREITKKYSHVLWVDNVSIHELIPASKLVVVVNSGTGMESLLHKKPVITFGRCEYDCVANKATLNDIGDVISKASFDLYSVQNFFESWYNWTYDTRTIKSFTNL